MSAHSFAKYIAPPTGPVRLREKPAQMLAERDGYALPDDASHGDYALAAMWCEKQGHRVPFFNADGLLIVTYTEPEEGRYYEWTTAPALIVNTGEGLYVYGYSMQREYEVITP